MRSSTRLVPRRRRLAAAVASLAVVAALAAAPPAAATETLVPVSTATGLRNAINAAADGHVIELADGTYATGGTPFTVPSGKNAHFTIRAQNPGAAAIDGGAGACGSRSPLFDHQAPNASIVVEGIVFRDGCTTNVSGTGGVDVRNGAHVTFVDCDFIGNQAEPINDSSAASGAVQVTNASFAQFIGCDFTGNTSASHGGAMLIGQGSTVFLHDSTFTANRNNVAGHRTNGLGGAIHVFNSSAGSTTRLFVSDSRFEDNEAAFVGGAIHAKGDFAIAAASPSEVVVANSTFVGNTALSDPVLLPPSPTEGGAISLENNVSLAVYHSRFESNSATLGGAISSYRAEMTIRDSVFSGNQAVGGDNSIASGTSAEGLGGAIRAHSSEGCGQGSRTASLDVADSFFENNSAQWGGAFAVTGDTFGHFNCGSPNLALHRAPLDVNRTIFSANTVDNVYVGTFQTFNNAVGGAIYAGLADVAVADSLFVDNRALANGATDNAINGGAMAFRDHSRIAIMDTTFGGNSSEEDGGAIHVFGGEIEMMDGLFFTANSVPGAAATSSRGAALFLSPDNARALDVTGSVTNSTFADNDGLAIFELEPLGSRHNFVTYSGNTFRETTFGDNVLRNTEAGATVDAAGLNTLFVDHGGPTTDKAPANNNVESGGPIVAGTVLAAPSGILPAGAAGDPAGPTTSYVGWAWSGGCAELDGAALGTTSGSAEEGAGNVLLEVFSGACGGAADASDTDNVANLAAPTAELTASPVEISSGGSSQLAWSVANGTFLGGMVTHEVSDLLPSASGNDMVSPPATTRFRLLGVTVRGGASDVQGVFVDEEADDGQLFSDGFESGNTSAWSSAVP